MVVVGGLIFSQLVTLYLTPVFFTYMAQLQDWLEHGRNTTQLEPVSVGK
jgi:HAE1 family hydrophobic/amphiphilic exporter-1